MARKTQRPKAMAEKTIAPVASVCPGCGQATTIDYYNQRRLTTLQGVFSFRLQIRRCHNFSCSLYRLPYRPEAEGRLALPYHEFGLDVLALTGALRYVEHRSVPEIHQDLTRRGVALSQRTVSNLLDRYDELRALSVADLDRLKPILHKQQRVILAIDGMQPDVGHEVLWVIRDCLSGEILLAVSLLSSTQDDLATLLTSVKERLEQMPVSIAGVVSDGQHSIRKAVAKALPDVPHQLCQFHYLREAGLPIFEADRHAKKELKKRVRGIRKIERKVEGRQDRKAQIIQGYCAAVRSALTDDGRPPMDSAGLVLHQRLQAIASSLDRLPCQAALPRELTRLRQLIGKGLTQTEELWPAVAEGFKWVRRVAHVLSNATEQSGRQVRSKWRRILVQMERKAQQHKEQGETALAEALQHFVRVSQSYAPGLFRCYDVLDLPRTNNDLEQLFGSHRYHERRASGRKGASPGLVVRGQVRLVAAVATRIRVVEGRELAPRRLEQWQQQRQELDRRRHTRICQRRFRRDPEAYLSYLESLYRHLLLPA
jgi:hypothetical protein